MVWEKTLQKLKDALAVIALGAIIAVIPFYFETRAATSEAERINKQQTVLLEQTRAELHALEIRGAIDNTEIEQIKQSLERIEEKIDKLIDNR